MPIKVSCACGKSFAAPDNLAGKKVKCPACQQPLAIPAAGPQPALSPLGPPSPAAAQPGSPLPSLSAPNSLFDEAGMKAAPPGTIACPGCTAPLAPGVVLCVKCGYNMKLGKKMGTTVVSADGVATGSSGHGHHGDVAQTLLARAAASIAEDRRAELEKTQSGVPWWVYLFALFMAVGFLIGMTLLPKHVALYAGACVIVMAGVGMSFFGWIRVIMIAFEDSALHGILCLTIGFYWMYYCFAHWDRCSPFFMMNFASSFVIGAGLGMYELGNYMKDGGEETRNNMPTNRPVIVAVVDHPLTTIAALSHPIAC